MRNMNERGTSASSEQTKLCRMFYFDTVYGHQFSGHVATLESSRAQQGLTHLQPPTRPSHIVPWFLCGLLN